MRASNDTEVGGMVGLFATIRQVLSLPLNSQDVTGDSVGSLTDRPHLPCLPTWYSWLPKQGLQPRETLLL